KKPAMNSEQAENLSALGYAASTSATVSPDPLKGDDPKDKIQVSNVLHEGMIAVEDGRYAEAIPMLQQVLQESPLISAAQLQLGVALARIRRYPEAIATLKKTVQMIPESSVRFFSAWRSPPDIAGFWPRPPQAATAPR